MTPSIERDYTLVKLLMRRTRNHKLNTAFMIREAGLDEDAFACHAPVIAVLQAAGLGGYIRVDRLIEIIGRRNSDGLETSSEIFRAVRAETYAMVARGNAVSTADAEDLFA